MADDRSTTPNDGGDGGAAEGAPAPQGDFPHAVIHTPHPDHYDPEGWGARAPLGGDGGSPSMLGGRMWAPRLSGL